MFAAFFGALPIRARFLILLSLACGSASAQTAIPLWPAGAPGAKGTADADKPALTPYPAANPNGAALVILPGGGYVNLATSYEGDTPAKWFNGLGITCFVLKYRLGPTYHHPIEMWDGQRAMRWVRANAKKYGIDTARVGILGFSAGGHLAATVSTHFDAGNPSAPDSVDRHSCRPAWSILGYPVITMDASFTHVGSRTALLGNSPPQNLVDSLSNEKQVTARTPPAFLFHAKDDGTVPVKNPQVYYDSLRKHGVAGSLKLFETGGHGFGLADGQAGKAKNATLAVWPGLAGKWLDSLGFFKQATALSGPRSAFAGSRPGSHPGSAPKAASAKGGFLDFLGRWSRASASRPRE